MGQFSTEMRKVALDLMTELGNTCVLTKVTAGIYDPLTGKTTETTQDFTTVSAPPSRISVMFPLDGQNTNLRAFDSAGIMVPWIGQPIDTTWLCNGHNIKSVAPIEAQNDVIVYNLSIGEKL